MRLHQSLHLKALSLLEVTGLFFLAITAQLIFWPAAWHHIMPPPQLHLIFFVYFCLYNSFISSVLIIISLSLFMGSVSSVPTVAFFSAFFTFYLLLFLGRGLFHWRQKRFLITALFAVSFCFPFFLKIFSEAGSIKSLSFDFLFYLLSNSLLTVFSAWLIHPRLESYITNKKAL